MDREERMDHYVRNEMTELDRAAFEREMANDPDLKQKVIELQAAIELVKSSGKESMRQIFAEIDTKELNENGGESVVVNRGKQRSLTILKWVAGVALILSLWLLVIPESQQMDTTVLTALYQDHFRPFPNISNPLVRDPSSLKERYLQHYDQGDYEGFLAEAKNIVNPTDTVLTYLVSAQLATNQLEETANTLSRLSQVSNPRFLQAADWYQLMLALKKEDIGAVRSIINKIMANKDHVYLTRAKEIQLAIQR